LKNKDSAENVIEDNEVDEGKENDTRKLDMMEKTRQKIQL